MREVRATNSEPRPTIMAANTAPASALHWVNPNSNTASARPGSSECDNVPILRALLRSTT